MIPILVLLKRLLSSAHKQISSSHLINDLGSYELLSVELDGHVVGHVRNHDSEHPHAHEHDVLPNHETPHQAFHLPRQLLRREENLREAGSGRRKMAPSGLRVNVEPAPKKSRWYSRTNVLS